MSTAFRKDVDSPSRIAHGNESNSAPAMMTIKYPKARNCQAVIFLCGLKFLKSISVLYHRLLGLSIFSVGGKLLRPRGALLHGGDNEKKR